MYDALKTLPVGIVVLNKQGLVNYTNKTLISWIGEDVSGKSWRHVSSQIITEQSGTDLLLCNSRIVNLDMAPMDTADEQVLVFSDVTANRQLQRRIESHRQKNIKGNFAASIAHEVRTPVSSLLLLISDLKADTEDPVTYSVASQCLDILENMENLVKDMLSLNKGVLQNKEVIELSEVVNTVVRKYSTRKRKIRVEKCAQRGRILGNRTLLKALVGNLIENAIRATSDNGQICIEISDFDLSTLLLSVQDNGKGIPASQIGKVFDPYFTTSIEGTGLGLSIAKKITTEHRGSIYVERSDSTGTKMNVKLPCVDMIDNIADISLLSI